MRHQIPISLLPFLLLIFLSTFSPYSNGWQKNIVHDLEETVMQWVEEKFLALIEQHASWDIDDDNRENCAAYYEALANVVKENAQCHIKSEIHLSTLQDYYVIFTRLNDIIMRTPYTKREIWDYIDTVEAQMLNQLNDLLEGSYSFEVRKNIHTEFQKKFYKFIFISETMCDYYLQEYAHHVAVCIVSNEFDIKDEIKNVITDMMRRSKNFPLDLRYINQLETLEKCIKEREESYRNKPSLVKTNSLAQLGQSYGLKL